MSDFIATTVCQPAILTDVEAVEQIIGKYKFDAEVFIQKNLLYVSGYEWFSAHKYNQTSDGYEADNDNNATNDFLQQLQPYIQD